MRGAIAATAAVGLLLAGCGSDEDARKAVVAAAQRTTGGGPLWLDQSVQLQPGRPDHGEMLVRGTADGRSRTVRMTIATSTESDGTPSASLRELDSLDGDLAQRGETVFLNLPSVNREIGARP